MTHLNLSRRMFMSAFTTPLLASRFTQSTEAPLVQPYFPSAAHQFVWRNWDLVPCARIARVLKTDEQSVKRIGQTMHLNADAACSVLEERLPFNVLRRNWSFVPREQIASLLDFSDSDLEKLLDRDAFYRSHLGSNPAFQA